MSTLAHHLPDRRPIQLFLQWRWLVLAIAILISLVSEIIEGYSRNLHVLDELLIDGLVLPVITWVVLTFAAQHIARHFEREAAHEQHQRFTQRLAEHRDYADLTDF